MCHPQLQSGINSHIYYIYTVASCSMTQFLICNFFNSLTERCLLSRLYSRLLRHTFTVIFTFLCYCGSLMWIYFCQKGFCTPLTLKVSVDSHSFSQHLHYWHPLIVKNLWLWSSDRLTQRSLTAQTCNLVSFGKSCRKAAGKWKENNLMCLMTVLETVWLNTTRLEQQKQSITLVVYLFYLEIR